MAYSSETDLNLRVSGLKVSIPYGPSAKQSSRIPKKTKETVAKCYDIIPCTML
jgi:hypothetical protein